MSGEPIRYSIIIPVYNVADYLDQCINSVLKQDTSSLFELILVDDGSNDGSGQICDKYRLMKHVHVIHKKNNGVSAARNDGILHSQGQYLLFLDGDDYWSENLLSELDEFVEAGCDTVVFSYTRFSQDTTNEISIKTISNGIDGEKHIQVSLDNGEVPYPMVWAYLFQKEIIIKHGIRFDKSLFISEDYDFVMRYLPYAQKVYTCNLNLYKYRLRSGSVTYVHTLEKIKMDIICQGKYLDKYKHPVLALRWLSELKNLVYLSDLDDIRKGAEIVRQYKYLFRYVKGIRQKAFICILSVFGVYRGILILRGIRKIRGKFR